MNSDVKWIEKWHKQVQSIIEGIKADEIITTGNGGVEVKSVEIARKIDGEQLTQHVTPAKIHNFTVFSALEPNAVDDEGNVDRNTKPVMDFIKKGGVPLKDLKDFIPSYEIADLIKSSQPKQKPSMFDWEEKVRNETYIVYLGSQDPMSKNIANFLKTELEGKGVENIEVVPLAKRDWSKDLSNVDTSKSSLEDLESFKKVVDQEELVKLDASGQEKLLKGLYSAYKKARKDYEKGDKNKPFSFTFSKQVGGYNLSKIKTKYDLRAEDIDAILDRSKLKGFAQELDRIVQSKSALSAASAISKALLNRRTFVLFVDDNKHTGTDLRKIFAMLKSRDASNAQFAAFVLYTFGDKKVSVNVLKSDPNKK